MSASSNPSFGSSADELRQSALRNLANSWLQLMNTDGADHTASHPDSVCDTSCTYREQLLERNRKAVLSILSQEGGTKFLADSIIGINGLTDLVVRSNDDCHDPPTDGSCEDHDACLSKLSATVKSRVVDRYRLSGNRFLKDLQTVGNFISFLHGEIENDHHCLVKDECKSHAKLALSFLNKQTGTELQRDVNNAQDLVRFYDEGYTDYHYQPCSGGVKSEGCNCTADLHREHASKVTSYYQENGGNQLEGDLRTIRQFVDFLKHDQDCETGQMEGNDHVEQIMTMYDESGGAKLSEDLQTVQDLTNFLHGHEESIHDECKTARHILTGTVFANLQEFGSEQLVTDLKTVQELVTFMNDHCTKHPEIQHTAQCDGDCNCLSRLDTIHRGQVAGEYARNKNMQLLLNLAHLDASFQRSVDPPTLTTHSTSDISPGQNQDDRTSSDRAGLEGSTPAETP